MGRYNDDLYHQVRQLNISSDTFKAENDYLRNGKYVMALLNNVVVCNGRSRRRLLRHQPRVQTAAKATQIVSLRTSLLEGFKTAREEIMKKYVKLALEKKNA